MGGLFPIVGNTLRELARSKLFYNLVLFSALLIGASIFVAQLTVGEWSRVILDMGLSSIEGVGVLLACLIGVGLVAGEIDRRTIYPTLAKPVTRATFLTARYAGLALILAANVALMLGVLALTLRMAGSHYSPASLPAALLLLIELWLIAALAMFYASFTTPTLAVAFCLSTFLVGHLVSDLRAYGERSKSGLAKTVTMALYRALPNLELLNLKAQAANDLPVPEGFVSRAALYGLLYAAVILLLAIAIFRRRDLK
ncbi:MAG: ABC transporter permease [Deltaproteobacteria bacterium]|nr:MAG: ABC transporter permease [Deltaproteobacteria bacterium]